MKTVRLRSCQCSSIRTQTIIGWESFKQEHKSNLQPCSSMLSTDRRTGQSLHSQNCGMVEIRMLKIRTSCPLDFPFHVIFIRVAFTVHVVLRNLNHFGKRTIPTKKHMRCHFVLVAAFRTGDDHDVPHSQVFESKIKFEAMFYWLISRNIIGVVFVHTSCSCFVLNF